jgi:hypothetical protein
VFEHIEHTQLNERDEADQTSNHEHKGNVQEPGCEEKPTKKEKQKAKIKNRKVAKQVERRRFLESLPLEERKQFIYSEKDARKAHEANILKQLETAPKVYFDLSF